MGFDTIEINLVMFVFFFKLKILLIVNNVIDYERKAETTEVAQIITISGVR